MTKKQIEQAFNELNKKCFGGALKSTLAFNNRRKCLGCYYQEIDVIFVTRYFTNAPDMVTLQTLLHEMCHAEVHRKYGVNPEKDCHGPLWQEIARQASDASGIDCTMTRYGLSPNYFPGKASNVYLFKRDTDDTWRCIKFNPASKSISRVLKDLTQRTDGHLITSNYPEFAALENRRVGKDGVALAYVLPWSDDQVNDIVRKARPCPIEKLAHN